MTITIVWNGVQIGVITSTGTAYRAESRADCERADFAAPSVAEEWLRQTWKAYQGRPVK